MRNTAYEYSCDLGKEKGSFKMWDYEKWSKSKFVQNLPDYIRDKAKNGLRNLTLLSIAPTGSIALLAGVSSSTEPIFSLEYHRTVNLGDSNTPQTMKFYHPLYKRFLDKKYEMDEKIWVTAHNIDWKIRIKMQGVMQQYICTAISNTVNLPSTATKQDIYNIYMMAWKEGLKGTTIYRDGCRENILSTKKSRPYELVGKTYQIKDENSDTYYITLNNIVEGTKFRPFEIFINSKESNEYLNVITRLLSAIFRRTSDSEFVIKQLEKSSKNENGLLLKLAKVIAEHMGVKQPTKPVVAVTTYTQKEEKSDGFQICPNCGKKMLKKEGGCEECANPECNYGKCSI
jgi:ribonucleoside-diphosphate reductase alpha chain